MASQLLLGYAVYAYQLTNHARPSSSLIAHSRTGCARPHHQARCSSTQATPLLASTMHRLPRRLATQTARTAPATDNGWVTGRHVLRSHSRTVPSSLPVTAATRPSGSIPVATAPTPPVWP